MYTPLTFKKGRKLSRINRLNGEIEALKGLTKAQKSQIDSLLELNKKLITRLAELGIKVKFEKGEIGFETVK